MNLKYFFSNCNSQSRSFTLWNETKWILVWSFFTKLNTYTFAASLQLPFLKASIIDRSYSLISQIRATKQILCFLTSQSFVKSRFNHRAWRFKRLPLCSWREKAVEVALDEDSIDSPFEMENIRGTPFDKELLPITIDAINTVVRSMTVRGRIKMSIKRHFSRSIDLETRPVLNLDSEAVSTDRSDD